MKHQKIPASQPNLDALIEAAMVCNARGANPEDSYEGLRVIEAFQKAFPRTSDALEDEVTEYRHELAIETAPSCIDDMTAAKVAMELGL